MLEVKNEFNTFNWGKKNALSPEFQRIYLTEEKNASGLKFIKNCLPPQQSGGGIDTFDSEINDPAIFTTSLMKLPLRSSPLPP